MLKKLLNYNNIPLNIGEKFFKKNFDLILKNEIFFFYLKLKLRN